MADGIVPANELEEATITASVPAADVATGGADGTNGELIAVPATKVATGGTGGTNGEHSGTKGEQKDAVADGGIWRTGTSTPVAVEADEAATSILTAESASAPRFRDCLAASARSSFIR